MKFTNNRSLPICGGNASPSNPRSPPVRMSADRSRKSAASTAPLLNDANAAVLLDHELDAAVGGILDERDRTGESRGVRARAKLRLDVGRQQADEASGQPPAAHARIVTHAAGQPSMIRSRENRVLPCSRTGRQLGRRVRLHPHLMKWFHCCFLAIVTVACGTDTPEPPAVTPGPPETVAGTERLGWTQRATDAAELSTFRYAAYVDGARAELTGVSCQPLSPQTSSDFDCTAPLPPMSTGPHTLELATFIVDGDLLESGRSAPLQVNRSSAPTAVAPAPPATWASGTTAATADGLRLRIDRIAEGLVRPTDLAFLPDGRVLVAEEAGQVRVLMPDGRLLAEPALPLPSAGSGETRLVALAIDAGFARTHFVYAIFATASGAGRLFALTRFRETANALVEPVVLRDDIPASNIPAASLRGSADGTVLAAFDDGGDVRNPGDLASPNGKILRLNPDGTTPDDQAGFHPMYASDVRSPRGFDWAPESALLWIADAASENSATLTAVGPASGTRRQGVRLASYALPRGTVPSSVAFYRSDSMPAFRDNLLIASEQGRHLLRVRFDPKEQTKVIGTERLLQNAIGGIRVVGVNREGVIYAATADAIAALTPAAR